MVAQLHTVLILLNQFETDQNVNLNKTACLEQNIILVLILFLFKWFLVYAYSFLVRFFKKYVQKVQKENFSTKYLKVTRHFSNFKNRQNIVAKTFGYAPMVEKYLSKIFWKEPSHIIRRLMSLNWLIVWNFEKKNVTHTRETENKWQRFHGLFNKSVQLLNFQSKMQRTWYELCFQTWWLYYSWFPKRIWRYGCCMVSF